MKLGSPPHTRGIPESFANGQMKMGITPAHAGNTLSNCGVHLNSWDHPRTRGEYCLTMRQSVPPSGSPPHTRGILFSSKIAFTVNGITPAHAGNTVADFPIFSIARDHPRTRGEYKKVMIDGKEVEGSPPHTRGIQVVQHLLLVLQGITPAHAGNTYPTREERSHWRDHPRTRGEYIECVFSVASPMGSPPHTRGIQLDSLEAAQKDGITPAHAGNTPFLTAPMRSCRDHPRTRGEYMERRR